jgi:hypothetical protein
MPARDRFDPVGSAVRISPTRLVTARHVVADEPSASLTLADGQVIEARVVPSDYPGDLILLESDALPPGPSLAPEEVGPEAALYTVASDVGSRRIRTYDPGHLRLALPPDRPLARLHHDAYSQPGHSGGALVDEAGRLVGIVASGGEGRFEAIPAAAIAALSARSGPDFAAASAESGAGLYPVAGGVPRSRRAPRRRRGRGHRDRLPALGQPSVHRRGRPDPGTRRPVRGGHQPVRARAD